MGWFPPARALGDEDPPSFRVPRAQSCRFPELCSVPNSKVLPAALLLWNERALRFSRGTSHNKWAGSRTDPKGPPAQVFKGTPSRSLVGCRTSDNCMSFPSEKGGDLIHFATHWPPSCCPRLHVVPQPKLSTAGLPPVTSPHRLPRWVPLPKLKPSLPWSLCLTLPHPKMSFLTLGPHPPQVLLLGAPDLSWTCCKCVLSE